MFVTIKTGHETTLDAVLEGMGGRANVSLPAELTDEALANLGISRVRPGDRPADTLTHRAVADGIAVDDGVAIRQWALEPIPLDEAKAAMRSAINAARDERQDGTVQTPFGRFDCNERSRVFIHGGVTEAMIRQAAGSTDPLVFTTADNEDVALTPAQMIGAGRLVLGYISAVHFHARGLKDAIDAAKDHSELDAIDMQADWP